MKRFLHLIDEAGDDELPADPDLSLLAAYVSRELSVVEIMAVEKRFRTDAAFRARVQAVLDIAALPVSFAHEFGVTALATTHAQRAGALDIASQHKGVPTKGSMKRVAAIVIVTALPVVMLAQLAVYVAQRSAAPGSAIALSNAAPASLDVPLREPELNDSPVGRQLQAVPATQEPGPAGMRGAVAGAAGSREQSSPSQTLQALPAPDSMRVTLRLGGTDGGGHILNVVTSIVTGPRGLIFLTQPQDGYISVFDTAGRDVGRIGRRGQGPGEFTELIGIGIAADTLWTTDFRSHNIHLFSLTGTLLASRDFSQTARLQDLERDRALAYLSGGSAVMRYSRLGDPSAAPVILMRVRSANSSRADTLLRVDRLPREWSIERVGKVEQPFDDYPLLALSPQGSELIVVERPTGNTTIARVTVRRISTTTTTQERRASIDLRVERVPAATVDSIIDRRATSLMRAFSGTFPSIAAMRTALRAGMFVPSHFPAIQRVVAGSDGSVWLQRFGRDEWIVLDSAGRVVRVIRLPAGSAANVRAVTIDRAWLAVTTAAGDPQVARYDLWRR